MFKKFLEILNGLVTQVEHHATFRLKAFAAHKLKVVYEQLDYLNSDTAKFSEIHQQTLQKFEQCQQLQKDEIQKSQTKQAPFFALAKEVIQSLQVKNARQWYEKHCALFTEKATRWDELLAQLPLQTSADTLNAIEQLRTLWQQQGRYAAFSTPDLIGAYWHNVGVIDTWLKSAQQEFAQKQKSLPKKLARQYQSQLQHLAATFQTEKADMRASMLTRLSVGIKCGDLRFDDLVIATVQELNQHGALTSTQLPKGVRRHMTPSTVRYIQQIMAIEGTSAEKAQLATLLYYQPSRLIENYSGSSGSSASALVVRKNQLGITFAVPETVSHLVAAKPPFYTKLPKGLQFLFRGERAAYEFFQHEDCQYLLIAQNNFSYHNIEPDLSIRTLRHSASWDYLNQLMHLVASETKRLQAKQKALSRILYPDVQRLLRHYQTALTPFATRVFNQQLQIFDILLFDLEAQIKTRALSDAEQLGIEAVKEQLFHYQKILNIPESNEWQNLFARYQQLKELAAKPQVTDAVFEQATQVTQKIKNGKKLGPHEQSLLAEVSTTVFDTVAKQQDNYAKAGFALNYRITQQDIGELLKTALAQSALTLPSPALVEHLQTLKQLFETLAVVQPTLKNSADIQNALYGYFYRLLETLQNFSGRSAFTKLEGHLQFILKTILQLPIDETLRHEVLQLKTSIERFKSLDWDLFQQIAIMPRCKALSIVLKSEISRLMPDSLLNSLPGINSGQTSKVNNRTFAFFEPLHLSQTTKNPEIPVSITPFCPL